jgi:5-methylcytosine-specific restriction protein A
MAVSPRYRKVKPTAPRREPRGFNTRTPDYERTEDRQDAKDFYKSPEWRALRAMFLRANPLCKDCEKEGRIEPALHVHHIEDRRDNLDRALEWDNLEGLCQPHHNARRRGTRYRPAATRETSER